MTKGSAAAQGKIALITGALQGIGAGLVEGFRARGYRVVANSRTVASDTDGAREAIWRRLKRYYIELGLDPAMPLPMATPAPFASAHCDLIEEIKPGVVSFHFGLPSKELVDRVKAAGARVLSSATTVEEAVWLEDHGCDAVVAQSLEEGKPRASVRKLRQQS